MATVTNYENTLGEPMVMVANDDGTTWSGTKAAYEDTLVTESAPTA